jgi:hypothetical protein
MSTLVISFTGALYQIGSGKLTARDLDSALFYLGCARQHAFDPSAEELQHVSQKKRVHKIITEALERAEDDGRVIWRNPYESNSYEDLNTLLKANGYKKLDFSRYDQLHYNYPTVETAFHEQNAQFKVVWRG